MKKMSRIVTLFFFLVLGLGISSIAEEITLTTYYPAPYGAYEELRAKRMAVGTNYLDASTVTVDDDNLIVEGNVGIGTTNPAGAKLKVETSSGVGVHIKSDGFGNEQNIHIENNVGNVWFLTTWGDINKFSIGRYMGGNDIVIDTNGNVGIGMTNPTATLHVNGPIKADFAAVGGPQTLQYNPGTKVIGYDIAEIFDTTEEVRTGDLLVIAETEDLTLRKSRSPYEKGIVGVVSGSPAILFEGSQLEIAPTPGGFIKGKKPPVALVGRILCKVSIENGPIKRGDLLTSSSTPGHAMKATDRDKSFGTILGKALEPFDAGPEGEKTGKIVILVTLQ